jgi:hypothetical protein
MIKKQMYDGKLLHYNNNSFQTILSFLILTPPPPPVKRNFDKIFKQLEIFFRYLNILIF